MVVFLNGCVNARLFAPAIEMKFAQDICAGLMKPQLILPERGADMAYSRHNIIVSLDNVKSSVTLYAFDKACRRRVSDNLIDFESADKFLQSGIVFLIGSLYSRAPRGVVILSQAVPYTVMKSPQAER